MISQKRWYLRWTMLMNYSVNTWLSFFKLTLMDHSIFCWVQPPFILLKNTWKLSIHLYWTLMEYHSFGIKFFKIQNKDQCCWGFMGICKKSINVPFSIFTSMLHPRFLEGFDYMYTEWVCTHLHFWIEFLFLYLSLRVPVYLGARGSLFFIT